jgi:hypothetical protein
MSEQIPVLPVPPPPAKTNVLSILSLVCGILGVISVCSWSVPYVNLICVGMGGFVALSGLVTGAVGLRQVKNRADKGKGLAIAGLITSILSILVNLIILLLLVLGIAAFAALYQAQ